MASITQLQNGLKCIDYYDGAGERKSVRLGKMSMRDAEKVRTKIEELSGAKINGTTLDTEVVTWLANRPPKVYDKLVRAGLVQQCANAVTLESFIDDYVAKQFVKSSSKEAWKQGKRALVEFFGPEKPLAEVTPGLVDEFKSNLQNSTIRRGKHKGKKVSSTTAQIAWISPRRFFVLRSDTN